VKLDGQELVKLRESNSILLWKQFTKPLKNTRMSCKPKVLQSDHKFRSILGQNRLKFRAKNSHFWSWQNQFYV